MNKIKELALWFGWFNRTKRFLGIVIVGSSLVLFFLASYGVSRALNSKHLIWSVISVCILLITVVAFTFFYWVGSSFKYADDSRNWRLVIDKGWEFANKNHEAFPQIKKLIETLKQTKDPSELNKFMDNWESPENKKTELLRELDYKKQELKETEDIMSGKRAKQIKEEIKKLEEKIKKT